LGHSQIHFPFLKKKKKNCPVPFWTALCSSSPLQMQRQGRRRFLKYFLPALSLHPTCPKIPHDPYPYPHLHNHTLQLPHHHALHVDRVWWTSSPAAYKYRGENRTRGERDDFFEKERNELGGQNFGEGGKKTTAFRGEKKKKPKESRTEEGGFRV